MNRFPLTVAEMFNIETATRNAAPEDRLPILLMGCCGLRRGEAFGLQRRDLIRAAGELHVRRILGRDGKAGPVKAESEGHVPVPGWLFAELEAHIASRKVTALGGADFLFTTRDGNPIRNN